MSEKIELPDNWTKIDDTHFSKNVVENFSENLIITDLAGNTGSIAVSVKNIDTIAPTCGSWSLSPDTPTSSPITATLTGSTDSGGSGLQINNFTCQITEN